MSASLIGTTTQDGIHHCGPNWDPNGVPGPTCRDLVAVFGGQPLTKSAGYVAVNDVGRHISVLIYTDSSAMTPEAISKAQIVLQCDCGATRHLRDRLSPRTVAASTFVQRLRSCQTMFSARHSGGVPARSRFHLP